MTDDVLSGGCAPCSWVAPSRWNRLCPDPSCALGQRVPSGRSRGSLHRRWPRQRSSSLPLPRKAGRLTADTTSHQLQYPGHQSTADANPATAECAAIVAPYPPCRRRLASSATARPAVAPSGNRSQAAVARRRPRARPHSVSSPTTAADVQPHRPPPRSQGAVRPSVSADPTALTSGFLAPACNRTRRRCMDTT